MKLVVPMRGTWKLSRNVLSLTIAEMNGRNMSEYMAMAHMNYDNDPSPRHRAALDELSKPMIGILSSDGKILTMKPAPGKRQTHLCQVLRKSRIFTQILIRTSGSSTSW